MENSLPYNKNDVESIIKYAERLKGRTLNDFVVSGEMNLDNKGGFGQILESGYFHLENSNEPVPDFKEVGLELKSTPMKLLNDGTYSPKERLVLGIINYMDIVKQSFEESFLSKNKNLLIIFYLYEENVNPIDYKIIEVIEWKFPAKDIEIIRNDWNKIKQMVIQGRAHELSGSLTFYLEAMTKGAGHGRDLREQPFGEPPAKQRAFGLKGRYLKRMFESRLIEHAEEPVAEVSDLRDKSIEDLVLEKFAPFVGLTVEGIIDKANLPFNKGKSRYAYLARSMLGIEGNRIEEFEKAGVIMRVIRPEHDGRLKESISFPRIRYDEMFHEVWDESSFYDIITSKFLFVIFQKQKESDEHIFRGVTFWSISEEDLEIVRYVWEDTLEKIRINDYRNFTRISENKIVHVRPHARNREDKSKGPDGNMHLKRSFWLNAKYIEKQVTDSFFANKNTLNADDSLLSRMVFEFIQNEQETNRYYINAKFSEHEPDDISSVLNMLREKNLIEYRPTGIVPATNHAHKIVSENNSNDYKPVFKEILPDGESRREVRTDSKRYNNSESPLLKSNKDAEAFIKKYIKSIHPQVSKDNIRLAIENHKNPHERSILDSFFLGTFEDFIRILHDTSTHNILVNFIETISYDDAHARLFTEFNMPSNFFIHVLDLPLSYYRLFYFKYPIGSKSLEILLNDDNYEYKYSTDIQERFKTIINEYSFNGSSRIDESFIEICLYLMNDRLVEYDLLEFIAENIIESSGGFDFCVDGVDSDRYVVSRRGIKYISSDVIRYVSDVLLLKYDGHAIHSSKIYKNTKDSISIIFNNEDELEQLIEKHKIYEIESGYVCFNTDLKTAIMNLAKDFNSNSLSFISMNFAFRYGGNSSTIKRFSIKNQLNLIDENYSHTRLGTMEGINDDAFDMLDRSLKNHKWLSLDQAKDIFRYKCQCEDLFSTPLMARLGFRNESNLFVREEYESFEECLLQNRFYDGKYSIDYIFKTDMEHRPFESRINRLIKNGRLIRITNETIVDLHSEVHSDLSYHIELLKTKLRERCRIEYLTAHMVKQDGTGIDYIDEDCFDEVFYEGVLSSIGANTTSINGKLIYHSSRHPLKNIDFIEYVIKKGRQEFEIYSLKDMLLDEYGIEVGKGRLRDIISESSELYYIEDIDMVFGSLDAYLESEIHEKNRFNE